MEEKIVTGRLKIILPLYQKDTFRKQEFIVVTDAQYPQAIKIELLNDKINLLSGFMCGDEVEVSINIRGKEWINPEGKTIYFNSIVAWRIKKIANGYIVPTRDQPENKIKYNYNFPPEAEVFGNPKEFKYDYGEDSDLPF